MRKVSLTKQKRNLWIAIAVILLAAIVVSGTLFGVFYHRYGVRPTVTASAQNVILLIGDGMGPDHVKAASLKRDLSMESVKKTGFVTTRSLTPVGFTDSAAAATAMATGSKTYNGRISYYNGQNLQNLGEYVKELGLKLGVITTKSVTDATPAAFTSHSKSRDDDDAIARQQIFEADCDVLFGLGKEYYAPYADQIETESRAYITSYDELLKTKKDQVYATFDTDRIPSGGSFTLASLTDRALDMLSNEKGFFLMVEGAKIDSYSHDNDIDNMIEELIAFDNAVQVALTYAEANPNTTVIITADHETGNLRLPKNPTPDDLQDKYFRRSYHSGRNVRYWIQGPGASEIPETIDNTDIYYIIRQLLTKNG